MTEITAEYETSGAALKEICDKHRIPGSGTWLLGKEGRGQDGDRGSLSDRSRSLPI